MTSSTLRGASRPRVEGHPEVSESRGQLAIELARRAGLVLDPWQQDSLRLMMAIRPDGKWVCRHYCEWVPRQNGKGAIIEARALAGFLLLGEKEIVWSAHEFKTAHKEFTRLWELFCKLGTEAKAGDNTLLDIAIRPGKSIRVKVTQGNDNKGFKRLDSRATILFVARSKGSGRGFSGDLIVLDEAFALTPEHQDAMQPTMRARPRAQVVYVSTPPLDGDSGEIMFEMRERAEAGDFERLGYRDWGIAGDLDNVEDIDLDDRALWAASNPALGDTPNGRISEEDVLDDRKTMRSRGGRGFARECLGVWPLPRTVAGGVILPGQWETLQDEESKRDPERPPALGLDIAVERDYAAIALYGVREDGLGHARLVDRRAGTTWIVDRLVELREKLNPVTVAMNRSTYASLETELRNAGFDEPEDPDDPWHGELLVLTAVNQAAACGQILDDIRRKVDGEVRQPFRVKPDPELTEAALGARTRRVGDTIAWSRKQDDIEISPWAAVTAARFGYVTRATATEVETLEGSLMV